MLYVLSLYYTILPFLLDRALLDCVIDRKVPDITSEAILGPSERYQNIQDNPEYNSVLPFRIILKIFAVNMLDVPCKISNVKVIIDRIKETITAYHFSNMFQIAYHMNSTEVRYGMNLFYSRFYKYLTKYIKLVAQKKQPEKILEMLGKCRPFLLKSEHSVEK